MISDILIQLLISWIFVSFCHSIVSLVVPLYIVLLSMYKITSICLSIPQIKAWKTIKYYRVVLSTIWLYPIKLLWQVIPNLWTVVYVCNSPCCNWIGGSNDLYYQYNTQHIMFPLWDASASKITLYFLCSVCLLHKLSAPRILSTQLRKSFGGKCI